jgi:elongation factor G
VVGKNCMHGFDCYIFIYIRAKLNHNAALVQLPIGLESEHSGAVDLIRWKAYYFEGDNG